MDAFAAGDIDYAPVPGIDAAKFAQFFSTQNGTLQMVQLSPIAAAPDGTSATLVVPTYANGAFTLQVLGSASQPLLQIVPTLTSFDQQNGLYLYGAGFVENGSTYSFAGASVADTDANVDVYYGADQNGRAYLNTIDYAEARGL